MRMFGVIGAFPLNKVQVWMKPLLHPSGSVAVFVLNYCAVPQNYTVSFSKILALDRASTSDNHWIGNGDISSARDEATFQASNIDRDDKVRVEMAVRDVWSRTDNGTASSKLDLVVPAYDSFLLKLSRLSII